VGAYQKDERSIIAQSHETISDFLLPSEEMQNGLILNQAFITWPLAHHIYS